MTYEAAIMCLTSTSFRWSNPSIFNDMHDPYVIKSTKNAETLNKISVFCISGNERVDAEMWKNPLMWAYYGGCNKGIALEIDLRSFLDTWQLHQTTFDAIKYTDIFEETTEPFIQQIIVRHINKKQTCWQHEQEYRFVNLTQLAIIRNTTTNKEEYEKFIDVQFKPKCIKRIYLGAQMSTSDIKTIISIINNLPCYKHLQIIKLKNGSSSIELDSYSIYTNNKFPSHFQPFPKSSDPKEFLKCLDNLTKEVDLETKCNLVTK